jgi:hypothetical protein
VVPARHIDRAREPTRGVNIAVTADADDSPRRLEYMPVAELPDDPTNPKGHAEGDIEASIGRFGYTTPVEIDERTGRLVAGHGRKGALLAMRERGERPPDGVRVTEAGEWLVPVVRGWSSRSDAEARAYVIGNNQLVPAGGWLDDRLVEALGVVADTELGLVGTGFTDEDLDSYRHLLDDDAWTDNAGGPGGGGEPDESTLWPRIDLRVPVEVFEAWHRLLSTYEGPDDLAKLSVHLRETGHLG